MHKELSCQFKLHVNSVDMITGILLPYLYRPRSEGDNALGSIHLSVRLFALSRLNRLAYNLHLLQGPLWGVVSPFIYTPWTDRHRQLADLNLARL